LFEEFSTISAKGFSSLEPPEFIAYQMAIGEPFLIESGEMAPCRILLAIAKMVASRAGRCQGKDLEHSSPPSAHDALRVWRYATGHTAADVVMEAIS